MQNYLIYYVCMNFGTHFAELHTISRCGKALCQENHYNFKFWNRSPELEIEIEIELD